MTMGLGLGRLGAMGATSENAVSSLDLVFDGLRPFDSRITVTRAGTITRFNSSGVLEVLPANQPQLDYDPVTLQPRGLGVWEQRTNSIRNNTMAGAMVGTPGTLPTNWRTAGFAGLSQQIVGVGTTSGISYIDIRFSGTATGVFGNIFFDAVTGISASNNQQWTSSTFIQIVAGSTSGVSLLSLSGAQYDVGGNYISNATEGTISSTISTTWQRVSRQLTTNSASIAFLSPYLQLGIVNGAAIDITLRIGLPQLEQGALVTPVIPTSGAAATRAADNAVISGANFSQFYNQAAGTVYAEFVNTIPGSATASVQLSGIWGVDQAGLGSFNGYGNGLSYQSNNRASISGRSRYAPSGLNTSVDIGPNSFVTQGTIYKTAFAWDSTGIAGTSGGLAVVSNVNTAAAAMGTHDRFQIGNQNFGGAGPYQLNGYIRTLRYYPRRLSNTELQALTA